ncbi:MAG: hypothetical protein AB7E08_05755 [Candidatus Omnitrophota bacterium]
MLVDASRPIKDFMDFLNEKKLCIVPCKVVFLPDNDTVKGETGMGFAAYIPSSELMYVAGDLSGLEGLTPEEQFEAILQSVAHEYIHHVQNIESRKFDEDEAHNRAEELVKEYCKKGK